MSLRVLSALVSWASHLLRESLAPYLHVQVIVVLVQLCSSPSLPAATCAILPSVAPCLNMYPGAILVANGAC